MIAKESNADAVQRYVDGVLDGTVVTGKLVRLAVERYVADLESAEDRGYHHDPYYANRAIDFCRLLKHTTGEYAGDNFELRDWQKFIYWNVFGWRDEKGLRRFRWAYISVARGNGKSPIGAAMGNYVFIADEPVEPRSQVYAFATKEAQARDIVFDEAKKQQESVPYFDFIDRRKSNMCILKKPYNGSRFEPKGSDSKKSDGWILHGALIDELHEWSGQQRGLYAKIETAMAKRRQPLAIITTTAGDSDSEIWQEQYDFYRAVLEGVVDSDRHFAFIAEVDAEEDVLDPAAWPQANPMLNEPNSPVKVDELKSLATKASVVPTAMNTFKRYYANQRVASFYQLITPEIWDMGNGQLPNLAGRECHLGFDWGWKNDLAALCLVFPMDDRWFLKCWAWIPEDGPRELYNEPWATFIRDGEVIVTGGDTTDIEAIHHQVQEIMEQYQVLSMAADPNNCREFLTRCNNEYGIETFAFSQGIKTFNEPTRTFVESLKDGKIFHGNSRLLRWCADNVTVRQDPNEYIMPYKVKSKDKIDPIVAAIMGFSQCMFSEAEGAWAASELGF